VQLLIRQLRTRCHSLRISGCALNRHTRPFLRLLSANTPHVAHSFIHSFNHSRVVHLQARTSLAVTH
jgi:hypothetical protein